jgi:hypothetical protein
VEVDRTVVMMSLAQGMYFGLEGAGPRIWALLEQPRTVAGLCQALSEEFEVDPETCYQDILPFLEELRGADLIRVHDADAAQVRPAHRE